MANCQKFKQWLINQDSADDNVSRRYMDHIKGCQTCKELYQTDMTLEAILKKGMQTIDQPPGLMKRARSRIESESRPQSTRFMSVSWKMALPALSMAALILLILLNPFSGPLQTVDEVVALSIDNHRNTGMEMAFRTGEVTDMGRWFTRRLEYEVRLPNLKRLGLNPLGGLKCAFGKTDVALLFCDSKGKRVSLFVINPDDIDFRFGKKRKYTVEEDDIQVTIWEESGMVYTMVI